MGGLKGGRGGLRNGWAKGRGEGMGARGEYRFMKLMKLTKKREILLCLLLLRIFFDV